MEVLEIGHPTINSNVPSEYNGEHNVSLQIIKYGLIFLLVLVAYQNLNQQYERTQSQN